MEARGRILVVDDEANARSALAELLREEGYAVETAADGFKALPKLEEFGPDLLLTDLKMPGMDGMELMKRAWESDPERVVVVMTAYGSVDTAVAAMRQGAADYLTKPVDLDEVTARVRAVTRRAQLAQSGGASVLTHGALKLQPARRSATWKGKVVPLTNREFWLLETLVRKKGQILSRERLEEALYGWGDEVDSNAVEVYIHHLRRKFDPALIKTVRGLGYHLGAEVGDEVEG